MRAIVQILAELWNGARAVDRIDSPRPSGDIIIPGTLPTLYQILRIDPKAHLKDVRRAYRKLAREYHPDVSQNPEAHEIMARINEAFEVLSDPVRRMEYDDSIGRTSVAEPRTETEVVKDAVRTTILHRHRVHRTPVYSAAYTPGKGRLVTSSFDNEVVWWTEDGAGPERRLRLEGGAVGAIQAVAEDVLVAAGGSEQRLACWTVRDGVARVWRQTPKAWVCTAVPSPNGESVAVGSVDNIVRVLTADRGKVTFTGSSHRESVTAVAWSEDSSELASGSADATVKIWDARTGKQRLTIERVRSTVTSIAFSPDGRWLAAAAVDLSVRVFDLRDGALRQTFFGHRKLVESLAFHPRGWLLASAARDGTLGLWNVEQGVGHGLLHASHQALSCVAFSPRGDQLAAGGLDKVLRVWSLELPC